MSATLGWYFIRPRITEATSSICSRGIKGWLFIFSSQIYNLPTKLLQAAEIITHKLSRNSIRYCITVNVTWEVTLHQEKCYFPIGLGADRRSDMMSLKSKAWVIEAIRPRYLKAGKVEKQKMLDEFTSATGYHSKHAIRVLKNEFKFKPAIKGKPKPTKPSIVVKLCRHLSKSGNLWRICSKRLRPYLPESD